MIEKFSPVAQDLVKDSVFDCVELRDDVAGLTIVLSDEDGTGLAILFENFLAYRRLDEGDALKTLSALKPNLERSKTLYIVENSNFISWFNEQSYNTHISQPLYHYVIVAMNDVIDVICSEEPKIRNLDDVNNNQR
jgi:hypothetical protein